VIFSFIPVNFYLIAGGLQMQGVSTQQFYLFTRIIKWRKTKLIAFLLALLLMLILLLDWSFVRYRLLDESMSPIFWGGQKVITLRWAYLFTVPERDDLIIYTPFSGTFRPGLVIAVPGDELKLVDGTLFINSTPVQEVQFPAGFSSSELTVPEKFVCVVEPNPLEAPARLKLISRNSISGKILGHWQVLII
jgi:hypothetical protein